MPPVYAPSPITATVYASDPLSFSASANPRAADIDVEDIEVEGDEIIIYGNPSDLYAIKEAITKAKPGIEFALDEIAMLPKDKVVLQGDDLADFNKLLTLLDDIEDVQHVYHNVEK